MNISKILIITFLFLITKQEEKEKPFRCAYYVKDDFILYYINPLRGYET